MVLRVKCENCGAKYKLDDTRIKGRGAKITCPHCRNVFVVMKPGETGGSLSDSAGDDLNMDDAANMSLSRVAQEALAAVGGSEPADAKRQKPPSPPVGGGIGVASSQRAPIPTVPPPPLATGAPPPPVKEPLRPTSDALFQTTGPLSQVVKRPVDADTLSWKEVGVTTFKVKVAIGLVYDFSDVPTLKKYIADKRVVSTDRVSFDGKVWTVLKDINSLDEFFIDQWVALKLERILEEQNQGGGDKSPKTTTAPEPSRAADDASSGPVGLESEGSIRASLKRTPAVIPTKPPPLPTPRPRETGRTAPPPPPGVLPFQEEVRPTAAGLSATDLFDGLHVPDESPVESPVRVPEQKVPAPTVPPPMPVPSARAPELVRSLGPSRRMLIADGIFLFALIVLALYLGWRYVNDGKRLQAELATPIERRNVEELDALLRESFPISYAASLTGEPIGSEESNAKEPDPAELEVKLPPPDVGKVRKDREPDKRPPGRKDGGKPPKGSVAINNITPEDLFQAGLQSLDAKDYATAVSSLKNAAQMEPRNVRYQYMLGYALFRADRLNEAEAALKRSLSLPGARVEAHKWLGEVYAKQGRKELAVAAYKKYLQSSPRDAEAIQEKIQKLSNS